MTMKVEYRQDAVITLTDISGSRYTFHLLEVEDLRIDKRDYQCTAKVHGFYDCIYINKEEFEKGKYGTLLGCGTYEDIQRWLKTYSNFTPVD